MSTSSLLAEFDQEMATTRRVLEAIPGDGWGYRPHGKSWTLSELASHVANIPVWMSMTLGTTDYDMAASSEQPPAAESHDELLGRFDGAVAEARRALEAATPEDMGVTWTLRHGDAVSFALPRGAVVRAFVMNHLIHHRGQLTVYLRLAGGSVPSVYGPSADSEG